MRFIKTLSLATVAVVGLSTVAVAGEGATVEEVQAKVKAAAEAIAEAKDKKAAIAEFDAKSGKWAWKDTYVFVYDCKADKGIAHPTLTDKPILGVKDDAGNMVFGGDTGLCKASEQKGGGWVTYLWKKQPTDAKSSPKVSFAMKVEGTDYQVAAGIYADKKVKNFKLAE
ncbi:MAG: hypothetical protein BWK79_14380 [Beggiatoa sp. IS2]|nr:MAG: hypothetical protein BWK79_14380 [Beggiatoa sp. IS2]